MVRRGWSGLGGLSLLVQIRLTTVSGFTQHPQCILRTVVGAHGSGEKKHGCRGGQRRL